MQEVKLLEIGPTDYTVQDDLQSNMELLSSSPTLYLTEIPPLPKSSPPKVLLPILLECPNSELAIL